MQELKAIRVMEGSKVSHDYMGKDVVTFGYQHLVDIGVPAIGIPGKQNNLILIDVDAGGDAHKHDGRQWWNEFCKRSGIPKTYSVATPNGGFHYYFRLPIAINPETYSPPGQLADGIDIKWNGWVKAPPTAGYIPSHGCPADIVDAPPSLMAEIQIRGAGHKAEGMDPSDPFALMNNISRTKFTDSQIKELRKRIEWLQTAGSLSRDEWRDGIFSLKTGCADPAVLDELILAWTMNKAYTPGDETLARDMADKTSQFGHVGPGTVFSILKNVALREGAPIVASPYTLPEIIDKSKVRVTVDSKGIAKVAPTESNVASLVGAMFDGDTLFHDIRMDNFVFKGQVYSDVDLANIITPMIQSPSYGLGFENIKKATIQSGIDVLMAARQVDPHRKWLESLVWDGVPRINNFFIEYVRVLDTEYNKILSKNLWISMAARGLQPGSKFDNIVILEGAEGSRKSTLVELLGGDYYMSLSSKQDINDPDVLRKMHQSTVVELPELVGLLNKSGEEIKAILATRIDTMRALYARKAIRKARGFILMGTTNSSRYINSDMGYRRYWPIKIPRGVSNIDTEGIKRNREQLFAEAAARFKTGENYWDIPEDLRGEVAKRIKEEPLVEPIRDILENGFGRMKLVEIYRQLEISGYVAKGLSSKISQRITEALVFIGAEEQMVNKSRYWVIPLPEPKLQVGFGASSFI